MATPSFNRSAATIGGYTSGVIAISELDSSDVPTTWEQFEFTRGLKISLNVDAIEERDDGNFVVAFDDPTSGVTVSGDILSRDEKVRQMYQETGTQSVKGKYYAVAIAGYPKTKEVWAFYKARFERSTEYAAGTADAKYQYKLVCMPNTTGVSAAWALPTGGYWTGVSATGTASFAATEYYYTEDLA
jgi:hypothetical protein